MSKKRFFKKKKKKIQNKPLKYISNIQIMPSGFERRTVFYLIINTFQSKFVIRLDLLKLHKMLASMTSFSNKKVLTFKCCFRYRYRLIFSIYFERTCFCYFIYNHFYYFSLIDDVWSSEYSSGNLKVLPNLRIYFYIS